MNVSDIMSRNLVVLPPTATFKEIWRTIFKKKIHSVPIVDKKNIMVGIITREELLERLYPDYQELFSLEDDFPDFEDMEKKVAELSNMKAKELMRRQVVFCHADTPVMRALSRMIIHRIHQLPVVDAHEKVTGMVTKGDIFVSLVKKSTRKTRKGS